jgi:hypothetical protein
MVKKFLSLFLAGLLMSSTQLMACPYCAGTVVGSKDDNTMYFLGAFVIFTYIPGYLIYRLIKKYQKFEVNVEKK